VLQQVKSSSAHRIYIQLIIDPGDFDVADLCVIAGTIELTPIFPGSQVDFGVRIGMQEQGAATLADLAQADEAMQDAIISAGAVRPLLELTRLDSPVAQEHAARVVVGLCEQIDNQRIMVAGGAIFDLTMLLKHGSAHAMEAAAAAISSLCRNAVLAIERKGINLADLREEMSGAISSGSPSRAAHAARAQSKADSAAESPPSEVAAAAAEMPPAELEEEGSEEREGFRLQLIADAGGIIYAATQSSPSSARASTSPTFVRRCQAPSRAAAPLERHTPHARRARQTRLQNRHRVRSPQRPRRCRLPSSRRRGVRNAKGSPLSVAIRETASSLTRDDSERSWKTSILNGPASTWLCGCASPRWDRRCYPSRG